LYFVHRENFPAVSDRGGPRRILNNNFQEESMSKQDTQRGQTEEASESAGTVEDGQAAHNTAAESREAGQNQSAGGCSAEPEAAAAAQNLQNGVEGGVEGVNQAAETAPEE
jgi:glycine cleavage system H lipoate-binding protein